MPIACNAMFVMKSIASVWLSFDFVNRNLEERKKFGRDYNKRANIRKGLDATLRKFFAPKTKRFTWTSEDGGGEVCRPDGDHQWWSDIGEGGARSRNPYLWWHNTWTALHSYVTYTLGWSEKHKSLKMQQYKADSELRHSTDFRTIFGILIGWFVSCEIGQTYFTESGGSFEIL